MDCFDDNKFEKFIEKKFNAFKRINILDYMLCIPIVNEQKEIIGFLKPITFDYQRIFHGCVELLGKWRKENPTLSNSVFKITDERTKKWLDNLILGRKDRILFLIDDLSNNHIGHIAYSSFDFSEKSAEIDCVLRGEKTKMPGIMTLAVNTMIRWGKNELELNEIYLVTNKDNDKAINLYQRCGFNIISEIPLFRKELEDEVRWDPDASRDISEAERFEVRMRYEGK